MGPHEQVRQLLEGGQTHGRTLVVTEDEERAVVRAGSAVEGDAVADETGGELADAEVDVASELMAGEGAGGPVCGQEARLTLDQGVVRTREVGGTAPEFGHGLGDRVEHLTGGRTGGDALLAGLEDREGRIETGGQFALGQAVEERRVLGVGAAPFGEGLVPFEVSGPTAVTGLTGVGEDLVVDGEGRLRIEAEDLLGRPDLVLTEGRTMGPSGVLCVRRRPGDDR